jgi:hypothetical protein
MAPTRINVLVYSGLRLLLSTMIFADSRFRKWQHCRVCTSLPLYPTATTFAPLCSHPRNRFCDYKGALDRILRSACVPWWGGSGLLPVPQWRWQCTNFAVRTQRGCIFRILCRRLLWQPAMRVRSRRQADGSCRQSRISFLPWYMQRLCFQGI